MSSKTDALIEVEELNNEGAVVGRAKPKDDILTCVGSVFGISFFVIYHIMYRAEY